MNLTCKARRAGTHAADVTSTQSAHCPIRILPGRAGIRRHRACRWHDDWKRRENHKGELHGSSQGAEKIVQRSDGRSRIRAMAPGALNLNDKSVQAPPARRGELSRNLKTNVQTRLSRRMAPAARSNPLLSYRPWRGP